MRGPVDRAGAYEAPARARSSVSDDLSSYVSRVIADRTASGRPIEGLEAETVRGALLLTDIAGFSAYVDEVSTARPSGLEELARDFNGYFTDLVGVVYGHGGDVVAIAGDAFFLYWPAAADDGLAGATLRAAQAGPSCSASSATPRAPPCTASGPARA